MLALWFGLSILRMPTESVIPSIGATKPTHSHSAEPPIGPKIPGDILLADYASPETPPIDDLKKVHYVLTGYFSVVKDVTRYPIGGNADLAACLLGENINRQAFIRAEHPVLNENQLLIDRWKTPFFVHPEGALDLTIRSAGPDTEMFTEDDLVILPTGLTP